MMAGLFLTMLEISIAVSLVSAVFIIFAPFLNRRYAAKWKYWIWIFLAVRLIIPVRTADITSVISQLIQIKTQDTLESKDQTTDNGKNQTVQTVPVSRITIPLPARFLAPFPVQLKKDRDMTPLDVAAILWMAGSILFLFVHIFSYLHYKRRILKLGTAAEDGILLGYMQKLQQELGLKCVIPVRKCAAAASPMVIGFFHPMLILPEEAYDTEELFFILKHELVHVKRGDVYWKLLFIVANAVHWFHPMIWIMCREAAVDMELSCDERVTQGADYAERKAYTEAMFSALRKQYWKGSALSTQFYGGKQVMKKRFRNILLKTGKKNGAFLLLCGMILMIGLGTQIGCSKPVPSSPFIQMAGSWAIDFDVTDPSLWGSGLSYGDSMEISENGEFRYYIGIGVGGTGQCEEKNGEITVEIQPYEKHSSEKEVLTLTYADENAKQRIFMDWHGETVCWKRKSGPNAENPVVDAPKDL